MSIALERIGGPRFAHVGGCFPIFEAVEAGTAPPQGKGEEAEAACSSSSIGGNSDCSAADGGDEDGGEAEVQSRLKGPLETMDALEESLPIRRSISKFYCGKSKSFTSLADAASSSIKDLAKPENAYTRKRKNNLAFNNMADRPYDNLSDFVGGGTPKRFANSNRSTSSLTGTTSSSGSNSTCSEEEEHEPSRFLPPLHPHRKPAAASPCSSPPRGKSSFPLRSFSMTDLQRVSGGGSPLGPRDEHKGLY